LSDGGLAMAAFEMANAGDVGVQLDAGDTPTLFGEDQARYLIACNFDQAEALMGAAHAAGVSVQSVGRFTGSEVVLGSARAELTELRDIYNNTFGETFA
jgi:phosphoribosylformylglycinamidine synthase